MDLDRRRSPGTLQYIGVAQQLRSLGGGGQAKLKNRSHSHIVSGFHAHGVGLHNTKSAT